MPGTFLFRARMALFHVVQLDYKQQGRESVAGPLWILQQTLQRSELLCEPAKPPPGACAVLGTPSYRRTEKTRRGSTRTQDTYTELGCRARHRKRTRQREANCLKKYM